MSKPPCFGPCAASLCLGMCVGMWRAALASPGDHESAGLGECAANLPECVDVLVAQGRGEEEAAFGVLQGWLAGLYSSGAEGPGPGLAEDGPAREAALAQLLLWAPAAGRRPGLALGVGQALQGFFWWGASEYLRSARQPSGPRVELAVTAWELHEHAVRHAHCDQPATPTDDFLSRQCPWRWRLLLLLGAELGRHLAVGLRDLAKAADVLRRVAAHLRTVQRLPYFRHHDTTTPLRLNQNRDFFPTASHWPVWPRSAWPPFGEFLEEHYATFRQGLEELLAVDPKHELFRLLSLQQHSELAPHYGDWVRLDLVSGGKASELCAMVPALRPSCELLAARPEIGEDCRTYLAGAALARLQPGTELKPHFDTHARLAAHLGLRTPPGASMTVGGEVVTWAEGRAVVFDDTYAHSVRHGGEEPRYVLVSWFCHPCDRTWRAELGEEWRTENPLPEWCGGGGGEPPIEGYGDHF
mmetsp:Transcript_24433/g.70085  ORF Transcript_24433/g.70085 Transcript_24433/m.70085 type:complete len:470 (+) Transcript_24433:74-1483(+)